MKATRNHQEIVVEGKRLEKAGELPEAAAMYQKVVDEDGTNQDAVGRLLVIYRKQKEYSKELALIKRALEAFEQRDKERQDAWLRAHPKAAGAGKAVFKQLGGSGASALDDDPVVAGLLKRRAVVEKRMGGKKTKKKAVVRRIAKKSFQDAEKLKAMARAAKKREAEKLVKEREAEKAAKRKEAVQAAKQKEADRVSAQKAARLAARLAAEMARAERRPSLFVISLHYLVSLEKIDAAMPRHIAFLNKHFKKGDFLISGRQVPRTGGIIIAKARDRGAVERMMQQDLFVKSKLASMDIVEFSAGQMAQGLEKWVRE